MSGGESRGNRIGGHYRILERIGRGGMGTVYRVTEERSGKILALKMLGGVLELQHLRRETLRFQREFHTIARLRHPRVVEVYDYGVDAGRPFYTMEFLDGHDLREIGPTEWDRACRLLRDVASALAFLHDHRLLHRDLGGRNVRCTGDGRVKLIDFGVLANFGFCGDLAGTPPYVAPESLRGLPLDHRTDLFGLGALAYWLLTGREAYPARKVADLEELWSLRPPPPSAMAPEVPAALDELVLSMLSLDRHGRPASAVEVIERLTPIAGLEPLDEGGAAHGYLASAPLIGRKSEMGVLRQLQRQATAGHGSAVVIEATSGVGKSRLMREFGFEAQIAGALTLRVACEAMGGAPYGVIRTLARELLFTMPEEAGRTARDDAAHLIRIIPDLARAVGPVEPAPVTDPSEDRLHLQGALVNWFTALAGVKPLAILVDDVQRCDEASASALAALAHAASGVPLVVAATLRRGEKVRAPAAVAALADAGIRIHLKGLDRTEVEELVRELFANSPNTARLASWMDRTAGGVPLHCTELARYLVDRGVVRLVDGNWVIPDEITGEGMPAGLAEAIDARIANLPRPALALGEALGVYGGEFTLDQVALVAEESEGDELFAAIDQLLYNDVLIGSGSALQFRHDGLREALLRRLDDDRRRLLHMRVANALLAAGAIEGAGEVEVGWHFVRGGERRRGAELLARGGRHLYESQCLPDAIAPLEEALQIYIEERRPSWLQLELRFMLVFSGQFFDRDVALRHVRPLVRGYADYTGLGLARRLMPFMRGVGLFVALPVTIARWLVTWPWHRGPFPIKLLGQFFMSAAATSAVYALSLDLEGSKWIEAQAPQSKLFKNRIPGAVYLLSQTLRIYVQGRLAAMRPLLVRIIDIFKNDKRTPMREMDRLIAEGSERYWLLLVSVAEQNPRYLEELKELEALHLSLFRVYTLQAQIVYHRMRGEEDRARDLESEQELLFVRMGPMWLSQSFTPIFSTIAFGCIGDLLGLRRMIERLSDRVAEGYHMKPILDLARGEYHRLRGQLVESEAALRQVLDAPPEQQGLAWAAAHAALAETLLARGQVEEAAAAAERGVAVNSEPDRDQLILRLRAQRVLALAEAARQSTDAAAARLERAIEEATPTLSPSLLGSLHEASAAVALLAGNDAEFMRHLRHTQEWFGPTRNPALTARAQRLAAARAARASEGERAGVVAKELFTVPATGEVPLSNMLAACRGPLERRQRIMEILLVESAASEGYLYALKRGRIELVAPIDVAEPPGLADDVRRAVAARDATLEGAYTVPSRPQTTDSKSGEDRAPHRIVLLEAAGSSVVGAAVLIAKGMPLDQLQPDLLRQVANAMLMDAMHLDAIND